ISAISTLKNITFSKGSLCILILILGTESNLPKDSLMYEFLLLMLYKSQRYHSRSLPVPERSIRQFFPKTSVTTSPLTSVMVLSGIGCGIIIQSLEQISPNPKTTILEISLFCVSILERSLFRSSNSHHFPVGIPLNSILEGIYEKVCGGKTA